MSWSAKIKYRSRGPRLKFHHDDKSLRLWPPSTSHEDIRPEIARPRLSFLNIKLSAASHSVALLTFESPKVKFLPGQWGHPSPAWRPLNSRTWLKGSLPRSLLHLPLPYQSWWEALKLHHEWSRHDIVCISASVSDQVCLPSQLESCWLTSALPEWPQRPILNSTIDSCECPLSHESIVALLLCKWNPSTPLFANIPSSSSSSTREMGKQW